MSSILTDATVFAGKSSPFGTIDAIGTFLSLGDTHTYRYTFTQNIETV